MRTTTLLALCVALFVASTFAVSHDPLTGVFADWMQEHQKSYANEEFVYRWNVWRENYLYIEAHNHQNKSFHLAMNKFGDLTNAEFNKLFKGLSITADQAKQESDIAPAPGLPADFDWRQKGAVTHVKNQGQCGSCWSFSTTGSTEGANFLKHGRLTSLSEQNLVDCSTSYGNHGCNGGLMDYAFEYIIRNKGIDTEESYPYHASQGTCRYNKQHSGGELVSYTNVPSGNEGALLNAVATQPTSVAIDASHSSFQFYKGGVYDEPACSSSRLDHGVLAVGWGVRDGKDYWLVKNSWGADWGLSGYIEMSRNKHNQCGIATAASHPHA
ncbi:Cysteine proteinase 5, putative [Acanthamoeba castellanii str. Neff]|uniref:Cysteine proteinase 5, putative n=1 Tax=Acanthamoeba castellanii (strain ATCC 30010 / Neff) TaxID=1257118 RepID=L8GS11_ACACF|nr:Cysteine proteinase 5, putative [Acanthamoeba castellanii str. Neff]ELR14926.1 Cysteine proteinase 5, putative [Acanthamoeba castellanii str. Neff]